MAYHWCPRNPPDPLIVNELQHDCLWQKKNDKKKWWLNSSTKSLSKSQQKRRTAKKDAELDVSKVMGVRPVLIQVMD